MDKLEDWIAHIAVAMNHHADFHARAVEAVAVLAERDGQVEAAVAQLPTVFEKPAGMPSDFAGAGGTANEWQTGWRLACFELAYQFRERGLPFLREVALFEHDWSKAMAIEALVRLAAEGIEREETLAGCRQKFPATKPHVMALIAEPLLEEINLPECSPDLRQVFEELRQIAEFDAVVEELLEPEEDADEVCHDDDTDEYDDDHDDLN